MVFIWKHELKVHMSILLTWQPSKWSKLVQCFSSHTDHSIDLYAKVSFTRPHSQWLDIHTPKCRWIKNLGLSVMPKATSKCGEARWNRTLGLQVSGQVLYFSDWATAGQPHTKTGTTSSSRKKPFLQFCVWPLTLVDKDLCCFRIPLVEPKSVWSTFGISMWRWFSHQCSVGILKHLWWLTKTFCWSSARKKGSKHHKASTVFYSGHSPLWLRSCILGQYTSPNLPAGGDQSAGFQRAWWCQNTAASLMNAKGSSGYYLPYHHQCANIFVCVWMTDCHVMRFSLELDKVQYNYRSFPI